MEETRELTRELHILEEIELDPDTTQATIANSLGVAVGTVNWHLKRLVSKGYVKVKRAERRKLKYIITPEGLALRAKLTVDFIENSMQLYRSIRNQSAEVIDAAQRQGFQRAVIRGDGDIADVCRLTCLEKGVEVVESVLDAEVMILKVQGRGIVFFNPAQDQ